MDHRGEASACLARENALQETAEAEGREYVWVWEVTTPAVVMGHSADCVLEVDHDACRRAGVSVLRRESGGRTVLLSKGCLNYTLILGCGELSVVARYRLILDAVLDAAGVSEATIESTDLAVGGKKFAGCAQRKRRNTVLHHGTILYEFEIANTERFLTEPRRQPSYRRGRRHTDFLTNVDPHPDFARRLAARFPEAELVR